MTWRRIIEINNNDHGWVSKGRNECTVIEHHARGYLVRQSDVLILHDMGEESYLTNDGDADRITAHGLLQEGCTMVVQSFDLES